MLEFWFKGKWCDLDGWEVTATYSRYDSNRKDAQVFAEEYFKWLEEKLPMNYKFQGIDLIRVEET